MQVRVSVRLPPSLVPCATCTELALTSVSKVKINRLFWEKGVQLENILQHANPLHMCCRKGVGWGDLELIFSTTCEPPHVCIVKEVELCGKKGTGK